ncbi:ATP-binding protein [Stigmatella sp. ncwal1]|uniref:histidine kinase n=1 Tax=Stigmatella ashevillensis TaxID=2995309 RepID=A0ABT5DHT5_9BACT|nr:ATP-binding protein [Stigmatella ashevillena]MDC0712323.1 ATP-binding protein [Stigmatella ashevillena]
MHATLLSVPPTVREEMEGAFQASGLVVEGQVTSVGTLEELPAALSAGFVVLGDEGGDVEEAVARCRELHSRRFIPRTHFVVLTARSEEEQEALIRAGADECMAVHAGGWRGRVASFLRRLDAGGAGDAASRGPLSQRIPPESALRALLASTTSDLGHDFFRTLVTHLATSFRVTCALVGELQPERDSLRTLAFWVNGRFEENVTYRLQGTPCHNAVLSSLCHYPDDVATRFPEDAMLLDLGMRGYLGAALKGSRGDAIGVLAILHGEPLDMGALDRALLEALAARAGAELERIRAQEALEQARDFLRNTLDAVPDPLFVADRAHRFVAVNRAFCGFMRRSAEQLLGSSYHDFLPSHEADLGWRLDEQAFTSGQPMEREETLTGINGTTRTLVTKRATFAEKPSQPFLVVTIRDITDHRRLETQLRLADRMVSVGTMAAGVAHEINNPLAYVCSNLSYLGDLLARGPVPAEALPELREVVAETEEGIGRVRAIVQDLKAFARSDEERFGPVDVHQVLEGALRLVRNELAYRARLVRALEGVPAVRGNEGRLGQVMVNLLVNAVQAFAKNDLDHNRIRLATRCEGTDWVVVEVEDNGPGMEQEVLERIFDPFFTTKPVGIGTGLGLAICHSIVHSMGGQIEVRSRLGHGSVFRVVLPIYRGDDVVLPVLTTRVERDVPRRRLLLIDDEPAVGTSVRRLLQGVHEVHAVQDAREALSLLSRGEQYDAILCDVVMPGMSGVDFLRELEQREPLMARRTGLMSGGTFSTQAREFVASRSSDLLEKPFEPERLRTFVERLLA